MPCERKPPGRCRPSESRRVFADFFPVDGDTWHHTPELADKDNRRDNDLKTDGWQVMRFSTRHIMEETETYCVPTILDTINALGGIDAFVPRYVDPDADSPRQPSLFD